MTDALQRYDLRDYQLLKSRKPGSRSKPVNNLPAIPYSTKVKGMGVPIFATITMYLFRQVDVEKIAQLVHGDFEKHMEEKNVQRDERQKKARRDRIRKAMSTHHQNWLEVSKGKGATYHAKHKLCTANATETY